MNASVDAAPKFATYFLRDSNQKIQVLANKGRRAKWWRRTGSKSRGFAYATHDGKPITEKGTLGRIGSLAIPPAWRHVKISPAPTGRVQAVGVDASGRLQYIYHPKFAEAQQRKKFARIERFGEFMPGFRKITNEHISLDGFPREKVLAIMTRLMNSLYIRVGTDESVRRFRTFGITTLSNRHVTVRKGKATFEFVGKSRIKHRKVLVDEDLAALIKDLTTIGRGRKLFQYLDEDGKARPVTPSQLNAYIKSITSEDFTAKDFRTWGASLLAAVEFAAIGPEPDEKLRTKNIVRVVRRVAAQLGNTPTVCRASYIHPTIINSYDKGKTIKPTEAGTRSSKKIEGDLSPEEISLLEMFKNPC